MRPQPSFFPNTVSRRQRRHRFLLTEVTCHREQRAPRCGAAEIRVADGTRAARHVPNLTPAPMGQEVLGSTRTPRRPASQTLVGTRRRSTRVQRALTLVNKPTEEPTIRNSLAGCDGGKVVPTITAPAHAFAGTGLTTSLDLGPAVHTASNSWADRLRWNALLSRCAAWRFFLGTTCFQRSA